MEELVRPATRKSVTDDIVSLLASLVKSGKLKPGDKLPSEHQLVTMFQVGRSSVREAISFLIARNVLYAQQGRGVFVRENPGFIDSGLGLEYLPSDDSSLRYRTHIIETRMVVEVQAAGLAAERRSQKDIEKLQQANDLLAESVFGTGMPNMEAEIRFHTTIAKATGNDVLARIVKSLLSGAKVVRRITFTIPGALERAVEDHQRIIAAITAEDTEGARVAMTDHLEYVLHQVNRSAAVSTESVESK